MKKLGTYLLYGGALAFAIALIWISVNPNKKTEFKSSNAQKVSQATKTQATEPAEKVQVFVFHSTNRCYSCVTMGQYTKATVEEFFNQSFVMEKLSSGKSMWTCQRIKKWLLNSRQQAHLFF